MRVLTALTFALILTAPAWAETIVEYSRILP